MLRTPLHKNLQRLVDDSKHKLRQLMARKQDRLVRSKESLNILKRIVQTHCGIGDTSKEESGDSSEERFGDSSDECSGDSTEEWSGSSGDESVDSVEEAKSRVIIEWEENKSTAEEHIEDEVWEKLTSESMKSKNIPWMLHYIEEHMRSLHSRKDYSQLWKEIFRHLRKSRLSNHLERSRDDDMQRLRTMWETNDSVWLLDESAWLLQIVRYIMERIYPLKDNIEQRPQPLSDSSKLLATFQDRLLEWQHHTDSLQLLCRNLKSMFKHWPRHREVPADTLRKNDVVITSKRRHCDVITSQ